MSELPCRIANGPQTPEDVGNEELDAETSDLLLEMQLQHQWEQSLSEEQ